MRVIVGNIYFDNNNNSVVIDRIYILSSLGCNIGQVKDTDEIDFNFLQTEKIEIRYKINKEYYYMKIEDFENNFIDLQSIREKKLNELLK